MAVINVICHAIHACGLQRVAHSFIERLRRAGFYTWVYDSLPGGIMYQFSGWEQGQLGIFCVQPHVLDHVHRHAGVAFNPLIPHIGYWYWETSRVPEDWLDICDKFQIKELWAPTPYVREAMQATIKHIPVYDVLPYIAEPTDFSPPVSLLPKLDPKRFTFTYIFDYGSVYERKNPMALVQAFRKAFKRQDKVQLVLKSMRSKEVPFQSGPLLALVDEPGAPIIVHDEMLQLSEVYGLLQKTDCYISPHRSEGLGLTMLEAFYLGKPVIATGYGGNLSFMPRPYPYLIDAPEIRIPKAVRIYGDSGCWSEPSVDHMVELMRYVLKHPDEASAVGLAGQARVRQMFDRDKLVADIKPHMRRNGIVI
jgi:glycosyltransferase involved in cell wall biosynthesis